MRTHHPSPAVATRSLATAILLVTVVAACGDRADTAADSPAVGAAPDDAARLARRVTILTPADGDTVGPEVRVTLGVTGLTIEPANNAHEDGKGHHHLLLDTTLVALDAAIPPTSQATAAKQFVHLGTGAAEHTFSGLAPGPHRIIAVVAYGDHVPMAGTMTDTVNIVVRRP
jgi:hypothetical protein